MRISDWSSDVCSSDLHHLPVQTDPPTPAPTPGRPPTQANLRPKPAENREERPQVRIIGLRPSAPPRTCGPNPRQTAKNGRRFAWGGALPRAEAGPVRSDKQTPELQSLMRIWYAVFCLN